MPTDAKRLLMRHASQPTTKDWFRIQNKAGSEDVTQVYIYDEIGFWGTTASDFVQQLAAITTDKIELHLNSPGGEIFDGVAIYQSLKGHHATVDVYIDALAASAASFIAQAGDNVHIGRNATMMIHDGLALVYGNAQDMKDTGSLLDKLSDNIADIYFQRAGGSAEEWRALMKAETWYNAAEAVEAGLADDEFEVAKADDSSDKKFALLNTFKFSSRTTAPSPEDVRQRVVNRVKEARMSQAAGAPAEGTNPEGQEPDGQNPEGQQPEGESTEGENGAGESSTVPEVPVTTTTTTTETGVVAPPTSGVQPQNAAVVFNIGGQQVTDPTAVQTYINSLEGAARETKMQNRKEFVQGLAASNKITAPQATQLEAFVTDDEMTDKQYETWRASWDAAPSQALLGDHAGGAGQSVETTTQAKADEDKINVARAIVKQHQMSNMDPDKIMATESYKTVIAADPEFKL